MAERAAVELTELSVRYPHFVLGPLTFTLSGGERVALVGPNGAGKSTTLRAIAGLVPGYAGSVTVEGREVRDVGPRVRARVGVLPERLLGFGWTTVAEHLELLASFYPTWDPAYADELRTRLDLPEANRRQLVAAGVSGTRIHVAGLCTCCSGGEFYSWRRDRQTAARMLNSIEIP